MITPAQIDAVNFGDIVCIQLPGTATLTTTLIGRVRDVNGLKVVGELWLTSGIPAGTVDWEYHYDGTGRAVPRAHVSTGYSSEWVMRNGTLTVLESQTS